MDDPEVRERVTRVEALLDEVASLPDAGARGTAEELVRALLDVYGEGLARILARVADLGGEDTVRELAKDELVSYLLLLHGLHPVSVEERAAQALDDVRPYLRSHGGNVELLGIEDGVAHLRLQGSCRGCPSSAMTLKLAIEEAITKAAPDLSGIEAEGVTPAQPAPVTFVPRSSRRVEESSAWTMVGALPQLATDGRLMREVGGEPVLFLRLAGEYYAYQARCPGCGDSLVGSQLAGAELTCGECGHAFDIQRAGRCLDAPRLHLDPIPLLLSEAGLVKIALRSGVGEPT